MDIVVKPAATWALGDSLLERCTNLTRAYTAVAHPCDAVSIQAAAEAAGLGLIEPILVGPAHKVLAAAAQAQVDVSSFTLIDVPHSHAAAAKAVALVRGGQAALLMKGSLHTDELMHEVLKVDCGLQTGRRVSHVYLIEAESYPKPLLITDGAINIAPDLDAKRDKLGHLLPARPCCGGEEE